MSYNLKRIMVAAVVTGLITSSVNAETIAIKGGKAYTLTSQGAIDNATIIIKNGKIAAIGQNVKIPSDARIIDAKGKIIVPGFMQSVSELGQKGIPSLGTSRDASAYDSGMTAAFKVEYALDPHANIVGDNRRNGLTRAVSSPSGSGHLFMGTGALITLDGQQDMRIGDAPMFARLDAAGNRNVSWAKIRLIMDQVKNFQKNRSRMMKGQGRRDYLLSFADMDALIPIARGDKKLALSLSSRNDILQAIKFAKEYKIKLIIIGAAEAWLVADELAAAKIPVVINPFENLPEGHDAIHATLSNAAKLEKAGVLFAIRVVDTAATHTAYLVAQGAGNAVAHGLSYVGALKSITVNPAKIFGLSNVYGTLAKGMDADIVVWDGDPLEVTSNVDHVIIRGVEYEKTSRRSKLRDRYMDLNNENSKPFALR